MSNQRAEKLATVEAISDGLASLNYISNLHISTAVFLAHHLDKPVLIEGPPGVGKTELAKSVAALLDMECVRLQCYEGLDESKAIYEWKYGKQLLYTQVLKKLSARYWKAQKDCLSPLPNCTNLAMFFSLKNS